MALPSLSSQCFQFSTTMLQIRWKRKISRQSIKSFKLTKRNKPRKKPSPEREGFFCIIFSFVIFVHSRLPLCRKRSLTSSVGHGADSLFQVRGTSLPDRGGSFRSVRCRHQAPSDLVYRLQRGHGCNRALPCRTGC